MQNLRKYLIVFSTLLVFSAKAQFNYNETISKSHEAILNLDFNSSAQLLENNINKADGFYYWLKSYREFVNYITTNQAVNSDDLLYNLDSNIDNTKKLTSYSPWFHSCMADMYLMKSYLLFTHEEYVSALASYLKAKRHIDININEYPQFTLNARHELILLASETLIQTVFPLFYNKKQVIESQEKFKALFEKSLNDPAIPKVFKIEMALTGTVCYSFINDSPENAILLIKSYGNDWPSSGPLQAYLFVKSAFRANDFLAGQEVLHRAINDHFNIQLNQINLLMGNYLLNHFNDSSVYFLNQFIVNQKNGTDIPYAQLKLAWHYYLNQRPDITDSLCRLIIAVKTPISPDDKQAVYECSLKKYWDPLLVKARLLFDGGNYLACRDWLIAHQANLALYSEPQKLEFAYRMARACHKTNDLEHARTFYQMAIHSGLEQLMYYPCYSAYYLATIYEMEQNTVKADKYFKLCTEMDSPIYKESIHQKARKHIQ